MSSSSNPMRDQILATPGALKAAFDQLELNARLAIPTEDIYRTKRIVLTGSGDSCFAAKAAETTFWLHAGIAAGVRVPMEAGRYFAPMMPSREIENSLLIALSNSGGAARVIEAASLFRARLAKVLAVTRNPAGRLAAVADRTLLLPATEFPNAPGFGPYLFAMLGLFLLAIRLGEVRSNMTMDQAQALRGQLKASLDVLETTIDRLDAPARSAAENLTSRKIIECLGAGPNNGVAEFAAAKLLEATGRHALARDLEEWTHLNYFDGSPEEVATIAVVPAGSVSQSRATELLPYWIKLGRTVVVVGGGAVAEQAIAAGHLALAVPAIAEPWSPLLTSAAVALLAAHLAALDGAEYGRGSKGPWIDSAHGDTVQKSAIWEPGG